MSEWVKNIPDAPGFARDQYILTRVCAGEFDPIVWCPITNAAKGHSVKLWVAQDALKIDGVRISVSHRLAQLIADELDARLPTSLISDIVWEQAAVRINAMPQPWFADGTMALTRRVIEYSALVDHAVMSRAGLVSCVGKDWILTRKLTHDVAANYGYHYLKLGSTRVWQTVGTAHNPDHHDHSQSLRLVCRTCIVDGAKMPLDVVLQDKGMAPLVSSEGAMPFVRHPAIPFTPPNQSLPEPT